MAKKWFCDGCGEDITEGSKASDGISRVLKLCTGGNAATWDLCDPCQDRIANALVELMPNTPRDRWFDKIRPAKPQPAKPRALFPPAK